MKHFQRLYSCAFSSRILMRMQDTTMLLCCAAFIGGSFMSVKMFPLEPVLIHPRTHTPLYQHPLVI